MEARHKRYLKVNLVSLVFVAVSFISVTLAWFAYSGLSSASMEVGVKAWYIKLEKNGDPVSNDIVISIPNIYPGMESAKETVRLQNLGDSDAMVNYSIVSTRILNEETVINDGTTSEYVEDQLSHEYPFHINMSLSKNYALAQTGEVTFDLSLSWPLDSGDDEADSIWGTAAYEFQQQEKLLYNQDNSYSIKPPIQVVISVRAEQYMAGDSSSDVRYNLGDEILFNPVTNQKCTTIGDNCLKTYVIDKNNLIGDTTVTLLPDVTSEEYQYGLFSEYDDKFASFTTSWTANTQNLTIENVLNIISKDVDNSLLIRNNISDMVIGYLSYSDRLSSQLAVTKSVNGYYTFDNTRFPYFVNSECYWLKSDYDINNAFAIETLNQSTSKVYGALKTSSCKIVPVIIASKYNL